MVSWNLPDVNKITPCDSISTGASFSHVILLAKKPNKCGRRMPHGLIKTYAERTAEQKQRFATAITGCVAGTGKCEEKFVSVTAEQIAPEDWAEEVYRPDILGKEETLIKKPGYKPFGQQKSF
jgi:4-oxalocrotonate tautomerase